MLKLLRKLLKNQKQRTGLLISLIMILIAAVVVFIEIEIEHNQKIYISNYMTEQQDLVDQVSVRMEGYIVTAGQYDITGVINKISGEVKTTGSRFWFFARNSRILFVKNSTTTKLYSDDSLGSFLKNNKADGMEISSSNFLIGNDQYTLGLCTKQDYIEEEGQLFRHHIYIIMPVVLLCSVFFAMIVYTLLKINQKDSRINQLNSEALQRNITIEQLSENIKKVKLNELEVQKTSNKEEAALIYSKEVLASLLKKINRENIVPLSIAVVELADHKSLIENQDYREVFGTISKVISTEHVLAELMPGVFAVLLFHTDMILMEQIKDTLVDQWIIPLKNKGIKVKMGISRIEDYDTDVENVFDTVYKTVSEKMKSYNE